MYKAFPKGYNFPVISWLLINNQTWEDNLMKKLLSVLLAITMVLFMMSGMTAFASEDAVPAAETVSEEDDDGGDTNPKPSDKPTGDNIPDTGDDTPIVLWAAVMIVCLGALVAVLPRKKHN